MQKMKMIIMQIIFKMIIMQMFVQEIMKYRQEIMKNLNMKYFGQVNIIKK
jgi:hypothetical protein